ncbi:hypothetical protein NP493_682g00011 [Ridgeia piscesae]|uniref:Ig-like domain-containing protein n=1 Tax=Ridgeia piscesae TaxID=27915 RepID=A0AAD9NPQ8_RIDPI|nr:hypothetical protein NP493_682g00011 [Ridgeia piscesae]
MWLDDGLQTPTVTLAPEASKSSQRGSVTSTCRATGRPAPRVYWVDDVTNSTRSVTTNASGLEATMTLQNATAHDSGRLRCVAENEAGMAMTYFHIYCVLVNNKNIMQELGPVQQNFFPCLRYNIRGFPSPNVTWLRDGVPLRRTNIVLDKPDPRWRDGRDAHELIGCLVFKMSTHLYNDVYTVVATNAYGSASRSVNVTILKPPGGGFPPAPRDLRPPKLDPDAFRRSTRPRHTFVSSTRSPLSNADPERVNTFTCT